MTMPKFKSPKIWEFSGRVELDPKDAPPPPGRIATAQSYSKYVTIGIMSAEFDAAYAKLKEKHPDMRIEGVRMTSAPVHYIADDPRAVEVANRLSGVDHAV